PTFASTKRGSYVFQSRLPFGVQELNRCQKIWMIHARTDVCPPVCLQLNLPEFASIFLIQHASGGALKAVQIELNLLCQTIIQKPSHFEIALEGLRNFLLAAISCDGFDHQSIQLGMLGLINPVVL